MSTASEDWEGTADPEEDPYLAAHWAVSIYYAQIAQMTEPYFERKFVMRAPCRRKGRICWVCDSDSAQRVHTAETTAAS